MSSDLAMLHPVPGIRLAVASAGVRYEDRADLVIIEADEGTACAAVFTRNAFCAAPVIIARRHLSQSAPRYLIINSGNANAGTGERGEQDALACCGFVAETAGCRTGEVLPFSTGVIGEPLPVAAIEAAVPDAYTALRDDGWQQAAAAIMTTDTVAKGSSRRLMIGGETVTVTGIAKGSGMIRPDMATMLAFIATDASVEAGVLQSCLHDVVDVSFNRITVDGDTSTNDACVLLATGRAPVRVDTVEDESYGLLCAAIREVCLELAQSIVRDGEGATRFVTIEVSGGRDEAECSRVAETIAHSPLVKTAIFAGDPNWGRILAAVGRAGVTDLDISRVNIYLGETCIVREGGRAPDYSESQGQQAMRDDEIGIRVELGRGPAAATMWTCDLSYDYVRINAEYRT